MVEAKYLLLLALLIWNFLVFITYAIDKQKAIRHDWRIPEKVLLWECLLFGGIGACLAGKVFRHKVRKWYFKVCWFLGLLVDLALVYTIMTYL